MTNLYKRHYEIVEMRKKYDDGIAWRDLFDTLSGTLLDLIEEHENLKTRLRKAVDDKS